MSLASKIAVAPIRFYQRKISPGFAPRCRYAPSCSQYVVEALSVHGLLKGTLLSMWRLLRCNPWTRGGVDRVPRRGRWPKRPLGLDELRALYEVEDAEARSSTETDRAEQNAVRTRV